MGKAAWLPQDSFALNCVTFNSSVNEETMVKKDQRELNGILEAPPGSVC